MGENIVELFIVIIFCFLFTNSVVSRAECIILHGCAAAVAMA